MSPFLLLLPLVPYPVLAYAASAHPALLVLLLPLYFVLPFPLYALSRFLFPSLGIVGRFLLSLERLRPYPHLAALVLPYLGYWTLAPLAWTLPQAYRGWLFTAGLGVPLSLLLGLLLDKALPPLGIALVTLLFWRGVSKGMERLARSF